MTDLTILHNPRCSTSRAGLEAAQASGLSLEVRNYLKDPLDEEAWLAESWADLADVGVAAVTLMCFDDVVYGPMSLDPPS